jgi:MoxR-like ATPase
METAPHDDVRQLQRLQGAVSALRTQVARRIVGQEDAVDGILTAILAGGHALLIGVPGLAKTLMVQTVAEALQLSFNRVQFTPDLMPSDITGTEIIEEDLTAGPRAFLMAVPTTWDDTRYIEGAPGEYVVLARGRGERWYLGGIGGDATARDLQVNLSFVGAGAFP